MKHEPWDTRRAHHAQDTLPGREVETDAVRFLIVLLQHCTSFSREHPDSRYCHYNKQWAISNPNGLP